MLPDVLPPTTGCSTPQLFHPFPSTRRALPCFDAADSGFIAPHGHGFRPGDASSPRHPAESRSLPAGRPFPFRCSPPCLTADAVTVGYKSERYDLRRTCTSLHECAHRRTSPCLRQGSARTGRRGRRRQARPGPCTCRGTGRRTRAPANGHAADHRPALSQPCLGFLETALPGRRQDNRAEDVRKAGGKVAGGGGGNDVMPCPLQRFPHSF